eukprot:TRINITY_DN39260_c0_g1_i1.p1 TRINITY_DN39260_c0_g1~~TRINITY_DN39260_c0_g1_i1.p1  ORF type:complete len:552 (+),score=78.40 TRINITY_DN39260_c0_g1_i1:137-1792(+)
MTPKPRPRCLNLLGSLLVLVVCSLVTLQGFQVSFLKVYHGQVKNNCFTGYAPRRSVGVRPCCRRAVAAISDSDSHLSSQRFSELSISPESKRAFSEGFRFDTMTEVQAAAIGPMLSGLDVVVRAKTGTGKTLGFLLPIVESIHKAPSRAGGPISALVISPTRELASQIAKETEKLIQFHRGLGVACVFGGTNINKDNLKLKRDPCDILVATPGRLQDHLTNSPGFLQRMSELKYLVLDEADQLLDMGFRQEIEKIIAKLPPASERKGALFSATYPQDVKQVSKLVLRPDYRFLNTVKAEEEVTPDQIDQSVVTSSIEGMTGLLFQVLQHEKASAPNSKIIVFFTTARVTRLFAEMFSSAGEKIFELHSKKSQKVRTKTSDAFRAAKSGIMFSSDVSARGVDYPGITAVIQVGTPSSKDQYIHRLGRTGRAGKSGRCLLLLHDFEEFFLNQLRDLPVKRLDETSFGAFGTPPKSLYESDYESATKAYKSWLGYYNTYIKKIKWSPEKLVGMATRFAASVGAVHGNQPPPLKKSTASKMGLKGVAGLNIISGC